MMNNNDTTKFIEKDKFTLINEEIVIKDDKFKIKPIGYYQDAWNRFKKNKASVVALYFIIVIIFLTLFGPFFRNYNLPQTDGTLALHFEALPAKVPGFENLGFLDGTKTISVSEAYYNSLPEGIVKKVESEPTYETGYLMDIKVDYYRYLNYAKAYGATLENGEQRTVTMTISKVKYEQALERNAVIRLVGINNNDYRVQLDLFRYAFDQDVDDVYFWFGTTVNGEDLFTSIWRGSRISLIMAIAISLINITIGVIIGSIVGYYGSTLDIIFERVVDILANIPFLVLITLLLLRYGSNFGVIIVAFVSTGWIGSYSSTRVQTYRYKNREYVLAARSYGSGDARIIRKHILPNAIGTLITSFSLTIPSFIFAESTYSYLGIINYPGIQSVGRLLADGQAVMQHHFHLLLFPALYLSILMLAFNLFSNGLRDAFNPSLRGVDE